MLKRFFSIEISDDRVFGLDLLRFFAIFGVLIGHGNLYLPPWAKKSLAPYMYDGVNVFFVLSGFLIGGILLKIVSKGVINFPTLLHFWKRRWFRTVPAYAFILIILGIYAAIYRVGKYDGIPKDWWKYLLFCQNLISERPAFFGESWSLCIEEWFYLVTPTLLFGALLVFPKHLKTVMILLCISMISVIMFYRFQLTSSFANEAPKVFEKLVNTNLRFQVLPRLDAIMFGVFAAVIAYYFPKFWKSSFKYLFLLLAYFVYYYASRQGYLLSAAGRATWLPFGKSISVMFLLPFFANLNIPKTFAYANEKINAALLMVKKIVLSPIQKAITFLSLISYSMYLINLNLVGSVIIKHFIHNNAEGIAAADLTKAQLVLNDITQTYWKGKHVVGPDWRWDYFLFWFLTIFISFLMYKFIEVPFMKMRK
jgi:peptidoglycan/LPS O-acetylase OafA/YrhL